MGWEGLGRWGVKGEGKGRGGLIRLDEEEELKLEMRRMGSGGGGQRPQKLTNAGPQQAHPSSSP